MLRQVSLPGNTDLEDEEGGGDDGGSEKYASNIKLNRNKLDEGAPLVTHTLIQTITRTSFISKPSSSSRFSAI